MMPLTLDAQELRHRYGDTVALDGVSLTIAAGSAVALVGASGSGKSTLLRAFNRMVVCDSGRVRVGGVPVDATAPELLRRRLGYVPQQGGLLPHWTVRQNVALVPRLTGTGDNSAAAVDDVLALVGLDPSRFGARYPFELSGGQRQRVALARALAAEQEVVLLDEPFGALDAISRAEAHEAFERVRAARGFTTLLVTHDLAEAARLADHVAVMHRGRIEQTGTMGELRASPATPYVAELFARAFAAHAALVRA
jgi:osmoprotectant transport system ATP-binding protein